MADGRQAELLQRARSLVLCACAYGHEGLELLPGILSEKSFQFFSSYLSPLTMDASDTERYSHIDAVITTRRRNLCFP